MDVIGVTMPDFHFLSESQLYFLTEPYLKEAVIYKWQKWETVNKF